jgi:hypothetical protein
LPAEPSFWKKLLLTRNDESCYPCSASAPQSQPEVTEVETTRGQIRLMRRTDESRHGGTTASSEALPELDPWREVGWIFRDGACIAIERHGEENRSRALVD